ncbi:MAG TPA: ATP-binding protein, partial [Caballeronia sp.]|nr:ATP-binding protein [Caballeronia sp.]
VLPWRLMAWLALFAVVCYSLLTVSYVPLNMEDPLNLFEYFRIGLWVNFMVSVGLIGWFVARMSRALRARDFALADAQERLLRDERAVALGVQAATVAHEIGTPLSTIAMLSEELRDSARHDPHLAPYCADIELLEQQMTLCTSALARLRSRATEPAPRQPLDDWLHGFVEQWRLRHPHVRFELIESEDEAEDKAEEHKRAGLFLSDPVAVGQILTILLDNAARASSDSVTLMTSASRHLGEPVIQFDVRDQGPGIPAALRGSLGAMPVDSTQGGHGVGLYLAFSAATRLGGSIELTPASPHGTHAILRLADSSAPESREKAARTGRGGVAASVTTEKRA